MKDQPAADAASSGSTNADLEYLSRYHRHQFTDAEWADVSKQEQESPVFAEAKERMVRKHRRVQAENRLHLFFYLRRQGVLRHVGPRPREARRAMPTRRRGSRRVTTRSSARSGDSGESGEGEPEPSLRGFRRPQRRSEPRHISAVLADYLEQLGGRP
jgi:hypothetical protein